MKKIALLVLLAIVVVGAIVTIVIVVNGGSGVVVSAPALPTPASTATIHGSPSVTPSPASTRSSVPNPAPPTASTGAPEFAAASATATVTCPVPGEGPAGGAAESPTVLLSWSSSGAETAFVGVDTANAQAEPVEEVATSGSDALAFACPEASHVYTITLVGEGGVQSRSFTVRNDGYRG